MGSAPDIPSREVGLEETVEIHTPEMVRIVLPLAGLGSRGLAYAVDWSVRYGIPMLVLAILTLVAAPFADLVEMFRRYPVIFAVVLVVFFVAQAFYYILFETFWSGQTPGKRLMGLRVVHLRGTPVGFLTSAVRNFLRVADFLPSFYGLAILCSFLTARNQRLGDLAAGTIVVREGTAGAGEGTSWEGRAGWSPPGWARRHGLDLRAGEWERVRRFVSRTEELQREPRRILSERILQGILRDRGKDLPEVWDDLPPAPLALRQLLQGEPASRPGPRGEPPE